MPCTECHVPITDPQDGVLFPDNTRICQNCIDVMVSHAYTSEGHISEQPEDYTSAQPEDIQ